MTDEQLRQENYSETESLLTAEEVNKMDNTGREKTTSGESRVHIGYRMHVLWLSIVLYYSALMILSSTYYQFIFARYTQDVRQEWNVTEKYNTSLNCHSNHTSLGSRVMEEAQSRSAKLKMYLTLTSGLPCLFTVLAVGVYSDRVGRKFLFVLPTIGCAALSVVYAVVSHWGFSLNILFLGHIIEGSLGTFVTYHIGAYTFTSDLTEAGNSRSFRITLVESLITLTVGVTDLAVGYMIQEWGYSVPFIVAAFLLVANAVLVIVLLPESHTKRSTQSLNVKEYLKSSFYFYFTEIGNNKRFLFRLCGIIFFLLNIAMLGKASIDILFMLNYPLCWNSVKIGYFGIANSAARAIGSVILVRGLQRWLSDAKLGFVSALTMATAATIQSLSKDDTMMYISVSVSSLGSAGISMVRSILSKLTPQGQHGAMFGGVAFVEAFTQLCGGVLFSAIYRATLPVFHGAAFMIIGSLIAIAATLFIILEVQMRRSRASEKDL